MKTRAFVVSLLCVAASGRAAEVGLTSSWDPFLTWGGSSGVAITMATPGFTVADTNGDGRDDIIIGSSEPLSAYRRIRFDPASHRYFQDLSTPIPYPYGDQVNPELRLVTSLTPGGPLKAITWQRHDVAIFDLASGRLERLSDPNGYDSPVPVCAVDLNGDGTKEIVIRDVVAVRVMNATLTRDLGTTFVERGDPFGSEALCANLDTDPAIEIALEGGAIYEFDGYRLRAQGSVDWPQNGLPPGYAGSADIDGRGQELLFVANWNAVMVHDVAAGTVRWSVTVPTRILQARVVDLNADGVKDLLVGTESAPPVLGMVMGYDGRDGRVIVSFPHPDTVVTGINAGDLDGDGATEIAVALMRPFTGPNRLYVYDVATGALEWRSEDERGVTAAALDDLDGDGSLEVVAAVRGVVGVGDIRLIDFDATTFQRRWATSHQILTDRAAFPIESLAIGHVTGDARREVVVGLGNAGEAQVAIIDGATRALVRTIDLPGFESVGAIATHDFDGDGREEVVAVASAPYGSEYGGEIYLLDGSTGQTIAHAGLGTYLSRRYTAVRIGDVDGDGHPDIVAAGTSTVGLGSALLVMNGVTRAVRGETGGPGYNGLALVNADGDSALEIALGVVSGGIEVRRGSNLAVIRSVAACPSPVWALSANTLSGAAPGSVFYSCDDRVGTADLRAGGSAAGISGMVGFRAGIGNVLLAAGTAAAPLITTTTVAGLRHLTPVANAAGPYITPGNNGGGPAVFAVSRSQTMTGQITFGSFRGLPARIELVEPPANGTLTVQPNGSFTYRMNDLRWSDLFTVRAVDGLSASVPMTYAVIAINSPPNVPRDVREFTAFTGRANEIASGTVDSDTDPMTFTIVTPPTKGTVSFNSFGTMTYTPAAEATGDDTFEYYASDALRRSQNNGVVVFHLAAPPPPTPPPTPSPPGASGGRTGGALDWLTALGLLTLLARGRRYRTR